MRLRATLGLLAMSDRLQSRLILPSPDEELEDVDVKAKLRVALDRLTYREREIIKLRYGIGDGYTYTLEEVGRRFKVTRERVRQIERRALWKLRDQGDARRMGEDAGLI